MDLIPERWRPEHASALPSVDCESVATVCNNPLKVGGKPLSENQRYNKVMQVSTRLTELVKSCGGKQFTDRLSALKKIVKIWEGRKEVEVLEAGSAETIAGMFGCLCLILVLK